MTLIEVQDDLVTYADFEEVGSVSRARTFVTRAKQWLILCADSSSNQSSSMSIGKQYVENMMARATAFIQSNAAASDSGRTRFLHVGASFR